MQTSTQPMYTTVTQTTANWPLYTIVGPNDNCFRRLLLLSTHPLTESVSYCYAEYIQFYCVSIFSPLYLVPCERPGLNFLDHNSFITKRA